MSGEKFGEFVRRAREAKDIGLREMAKMIGVTPVKGDGEMPKGVLR